MKREIRLCEKGDSQFKSLLTSKRKEMGCRHTRITRSPIHCGKEISAFYLMNPKNAPRKIILGFCADHDEFLKRKAEK